MNRRAHLSKKPRLTLFYDLPKGELVTSMGNSEEQRMLKILKNSYFNELVNSEYHSLDVNEFDMDF